MRLAAKISMIMVGVLVLAMLSSVAMLLSVRQLSAVMEDLVVQNLSSMRAAEELEIALLEQTGYVASYILDQGNRSWLEELARREPEFPHWLAQVRKMASSPEEQTLMARLATVYRQYHEQKDEAIALYDSGRVEEARRIVLREMAATYDLAYQLCEAFIGVNERIVAQRLVDGRTRLKHNTYLVAGYIGLITVLSLWLLWSFFNGFLRPLRQMARDARMFAGDHQLVAPEATHDELRAVGFYLRRLMGDVSETRLDLERSRDRLFHSEQLASVGKLAASVAHEIRNPLTSLKMRLFSLREELGDDPQFEDDLRVVAEEIARLDSIIRSFLEFARPPEMRRQAHDVPRLITNTLELCGHRLVEKDIQLWRDDTPDLPAVWVDGEQLKQVFINLVLNATEAMSGGGQLRIASALATSREGEQMVRVCFQDSGLGIPEEARDHIFEPFFSTKESGTGLGLCIAASIMARHGGRLELESSDARGTTFAVWLPIEKEAGA